MKLEDFVLVLTDVLNSDVLSGLVSSEPVSDTVKRVGEQYLHTTKYCDWNSEYNYLDYSVLRQMNPVIEKTSDLIAVFNTTDAELEVYIGFKRDVFPLPANGVLILPNNKLFDFAFRKNSEKDTIVAYYNLLRVEDESSLTD